MTYKRYSVLATPRLKRAIALFLTAIILIGGIIGFIIGRATIPKQQSEGASLTVIVPSVSSVPQATDSVCHQTNVTLSPEPTPIQPIEKVTYYYDCPLDNDLQDYIRDLCEQNDVPMTVIIAIIDGESSFRASVVSKGGDYGLMQINTINHEWLSEKYGITDFLDPYQNVFCGITIFAQHYSKYGDVTKALMAYNCGATGAKRLWDKEIYSTAYSDKINALMLDYGWEGETK